MKVNDDINLPADFDDLSKHAPLLDSLRAKGDGFVVPKGYFSEMTEHTVAGCQLSAIKDGFIVPENYFEDLAERIIAIVSLKTINNQQLTTDNCFSVPEGYFEELTAQIENIVALENFTGKENGFTLPEDYFKELDETIHTKIALDNLRQDEGFAVPENYFEKFTAKIESRIAVDELKEGSDADVPPGYFDTLADKIVKRIGESEGEGEKLKRGRIIVFTEVVKRYAKPVSLAAGIALILGVSLWFYTHSENGKQPDKYAKVTPVNPKALPVIPTPKKDSVIIPQEQPKHIAAKIKKPKTLNPEEVASVKEKEKKELLDQLALIDENTIADYVSEINPEVKEPVQDESLKNEMLNYLDPADIK
jgi:hypothetical protein